MSNQQYYQNTLNNGAPVQQPMMQGGYGYGYNGGYAPNMGYAYTAPRPQALNSQPLTQDMANTLRQDGNEFNMKVDQREIWRAICTHKDPSNGQSTLTQNEDGTFTCAICGHTFNFFEGTKEDIEHAVKVLTDMMQTCKTIYLDAPNAMTEQYYQMICLLQRFPALWQHAVNNFAKYENYANPLAPINGNYGGFNAINQLLTNPYGFGYQPYGQMPQQPMMQPQMQSGYYGQPQMMQPQMTQPQMNMQQPQYYQNNLNGGMAMNPVENPMGYNAPVPGVMPSAPQPTAAPAPAAPAAQGGEIQQQKVYNV